MTPEEFKTICAEYDRAPDSAEWGKNHPIFRLAKESDELKKKYNELIMAVERKWDGETRHETALKYIKQAEAQIAASAKETL